MRLAESINIVKSTILISGTLLYGYLPIWKQNFSNFRVRSLFQMAIYEFLTSLYTKYQHTNEITSQKSWWALSLSIQCEWMSKKEMLEHVYHEALCSKPLPSNLYAVQGKPVMSWQNGGLWGGTDRGPLPAGATSKTLSFSSFIRTGSQEKSSQYLNTELVKKKLSLSYDFFKKYTSVQYYKHFY